MAVRTSSAAPSRLASIMPLSRAPSRSAISPSVNRKNCARPRRHCAVTVSIQAFCPPTASKYRLGREVGPVAADHLARRLAPVDVPGGGADHQRAKLDLRPVEAGHGDDAMSVEQIARRAPCDEGHQFARDDLVKVEHRDSVRPIVSERRRRHPADTKEWSPRRRGLRPSERSISRRRIRTVRVGQNSPSIPGAQDAVFVPRPVLLHARLLGLADIVHVDIDRQAVERAVSPLRDMRGAIRLSTAGCRVGR